MQENKKAPIKELNEYTTNIIIAEKECKYNFLPKILSKILVCCESLFFDLSPEVILNILLVKVAQMLTSKRIKILECENLLYPNYFAMVFVGSGYGKDRLVKMLNDFVFIRFKNWFYEESEKVYTKQIEQIKLEAENIYKGTTSKEEAKKLNFIREESKKIRKLCIEISGGTQEGIYADAKAFKEAEIGGLYVTIPEFGNFIGVRTNENEQFTNTFFVGYDCKIQNKCIKSEQREPDIEDVPFNTLFYSDPTRLSTSLKQPLFTLLDTGLNRRSVISFQANTKLKKIILSLEQEKMLYQEAKSLGDDLFSIFEKLKTKTEYILTSEAKDLLNQYKLRLTDLFNDSEYKYLQDEIKSRELKALKVSGLYACLNHYNRHSIEIEDMQQAIKTIEFLSNDLAKFVNYKVARNDLYDDIFEFFKKNLNEPFTKYALTYTHKKEFSISRGKFIKEFDSIIDIVKGLAVENGYFLDSKPINNNCGMKYTLILAPQKDNELNQLI